MLFSTALWRNFQLSITITLVLFYFALWLVNKLVPLAQLIKCKTKTHHDLVAFVSLRFRRFTCFFLWVLIGSSGYFPFFWLVVVVTLVLVLRHSIKLSHLSGAQFCCLDWRRHTTCGIRKTNFTTTGDSGPSFGEQYKEFLRYVFPCLLGSRFIFLFSVPPFTSSMQRSPPLPPLPSQTYTFWTLFLLTGLAAMIRNISFHLSGRLSFLLKLCLVHQLSRLLLVQRLCDDNFQSSCVLSPSVQQQSAEASCFHLL